MEEYLRQKGIEVTQKILSAPNARESAESLVRSFKGMEDAYSKAILETATQYLKNNK